MTHDGHSGETSGPVRPGALTALLKELAAAPAPGEADDGATWERALQPGASIGRFELVRELGRGGFGVVWEARDRELGRRVAFKAVRAGGRRELREERLLQEAEAAARLSHPNIVTLHDVGRWEHGPFLVLELLEGRTLAARLAEGALPVPEALRIAGGVAQGLAHAHERGVVHRDLKPENVFLCRDGQVKVLDLGLAHAFGYRRVAGGTPAYMAPEQAEGSPEDERTDVWAIGAIAFEMLTGQPAFPHGKSGRAPRLEVPGAPALGDLVARMLAERPRERPRDAREVSACLESLAADIGRAPAPARSVRTRTRWTARMAALGAAAVAMAIIAVVVARRGAPGTPTVDRQGRTLVAVADVVNETGERDLDVLSGLLVTSLEQSRRLAVMTQARILDLAARAGRKDVARVDETIGREVGRANAVGALLLPAIRRLGTTYSLELRAIDPVHDRHLFTLSDRATSKDALLEVLDRLSERARRQLGEGVADVAEASVQLGDAMTRSLEAYQHFLTGRDAWLGDGLRAVALREYQEAVRLDPRFASAHGALSLLFVTYGRPDLAEPHARAATEHLARMPEKEQALLRLGWRSRAATYAGRDLLPQTTSREEALRLAAALEARFPDDKFVLARVADVYLTPDIDQKAEAERVLRRTLTLDPGYRYALVPLLDLLEDRPVERLEIARRAVATRRSASNLALLARVEFAAGSREASARAAREALRLDGLQSSLNVGNACTALENLAGRPACMDEWRAVLEGGPNEHERDFARLRLAEALAIEGRRGEALRLVASVPEARRGDAFLLALVLSAGVPRAQAVESRAVSRRIASGVLRRYTVAVYGDPEEAERISAGLRPGERTAFDDQLYAPLRLAALRRYAEAAEVEEKNRAWAHDHAEIGSAYWHAYLLAELLLAAGRAAEAAAVEPRLPRDRSMWLLDRAMNGPRLALVRARAMERLGRRADALREVEGVITFWKDADPDLPLLVEVKALRRHLAAQPAAERAASSATRAEAAYPSIAVLPFADLSPGKDQEYFADGVAEEILNALTRVPGLKVVGRTSSFSFKGKKDDLKSIGRKLGAATVLEGSVRREGARVRVTAQLVKTSDGYQLWSEGYERELTGIFEVQDEVARTVVAKLAPLLAEETGHDPATVRVAGAPRTSPDAYLPYLMGKRLYARGSQADLAQAVEYFERSLAIDASYAPAWAGLAFALMNHAESQTSLEEVLELKRRALEAGEKAVALGPAVASAYVARGYLGAIHDHAWEKARTDLERAIALNPGDGEAYHRYGLVLAAQGRMEDAIAAMSRAVELDPLDAFGWQRLGILYNASGRTARAKDVLGRSLEVSPGHVHAGGYLAQSYLLEGKPREALAVAERSRAHEAFRLLIQAAANHDLGMELEARAALESLKRRYASGWAFQVAEAYAWLGEPDEAFQWISRADEQLDTGILMVRYDPLLRRLHSDPRWNALLRKMNLPVD